MHFRLLCAALCLCPAASAQAQFLDCMAEGYLDAFAEAPAAEGLACLELFRIDVATPAGPRQIRAIMDAGADWAAPSALVAEVRRGADLAAAAFGGLGPFRVDNITLLLLDDAFSTADLTGAEPEDEAALRGILGVTLSAPDLPPGAGAECLITLYALAPGADDGSMATTVAHEIFHCLQGATYAGPKYGSYGAGGTWWIEGAAEAFAAHTVPESAAFTDRGPDFDASVEANVALNDMEHEAAHFFYWLLQTRGIGALMPFQDAMADSGGAAAQHAAMRAALPPDAWQAFAEAYADSEVYHPQGASLASSAPEHHSQGISAAGQHRFPLAPFAFTQVRLDYDCGVWGNTIRPEAPGMTWKDDATDARGDWIGLPDEIDTREGRPAAWRGVALPTDDSVAEAVLDVERRRSCRPCLGSDAIDACLVGQWSMSGGGPAEWMRAQGFPGDVGTSGTEAITLRADGVFSTAPFSISVDAANDGVTFAGEGEAAAAQGGWSAEGGLLNICTEAGGGVAGTVTVTADETSGRMPANAPGGGSMSMRYACAGSSLTTEIDMRGLPPMVTQYTKVAP
jgi:hypothetical protein